MSTKSKILPWTSHWRIDVSKEILLRAFEENSSLVKVFKQRDHDDNFVGYLNAHDLATIRFYTKRNEHLPRLLEGSEQ